MSAPATAAMLAAYVLFVAACCIGACIGAQRATETDLPGPEPVGADLVYGALTSRAGEHLLAAPVSDDTVLDLATLKQRDPVRGWAIEFRLEWDEILANRAAADAAERARAVAAVAADEEDRAQRQAMLRTLRTLCREQPYPHLERAWADSTGSFKAVTS